MVDRAPATGLASPSGHPGFVRCPTTTRFRRRHAERDAGANFTILERGLRCKHAVDQVGEMAS